MSKSDLVDLDLAVVGETPAAYRVSPDGIKTVWLPKSPGPAHGGPSNAEGFKPEPSQAAGTDLASSPFVGSSSAG